MDRLRSFGRAGAPAAPLAALLLAAAAAAVASPEVLLVLAPAFLLLGLLVIGQAPGEELLLRLARRTRRPRRAASRTQRPALPLVIRRTGRLIAAALATRPPPARPAICG